jgi:plasmid stabilization system protein ParE
VNVRLTQPAEFDLERLADRIAQIDPQRAKMIAEQLKAAARTIGHAPFQYPRVAADPRLRKKSVRPFVLLFEVRGDHVLILRIAHERSDWASLV